MSTHPCERCGKYEILLPICGPCQREVELGKERKGRIDLPGNSKHGTTTAYHTYGCRCLLCRTERTATNHVSYRLHGQGVTGAVPLEYTRLAFGDEYADRLLREAESIYDPRPHSSTSSYHDARRAEAIARYV